MNTTPTATMRFWVMTAMMAVVRGTSAVFPPCMHLLSCDYPCTTIYRASEPYWLLPPTPLIPASNETATYATRPANGSGERVRQILVTGFGQVSMTGLPIGQISFGSTSSPTVCTCITVECVIVRCSVGHYGIRWGGQECPVSIAPSATPTVLPTHAPSREPTPLPMVIRTRAPTAAPTPFPSWTPTIFSTTSPFGATTSASSTQRGAQPLSSTPPASSTLGVQPVTQISTPSPTITQHPPSEQPATIINVDDSGSGGFNEVWLALIVGVLVVMAAFVAWNHYRLKKNQDGVQRITTNDFTGRFGNMPRGSMASKDDYFQGFSIASLPDDTQYASSGTSSPPVSRWTGSEHNYDVPRHNHLDHPYLSPEPGSEHTSSPPLPPPRRKSYQDKARAGDEPLYAYAASVTHDTTGNGTAGTARFYSTVRKNAIKPDRQSVSNDVPTTAEQGLDDDDENIDVDFDGFGEGYYDQRTTAHVSGTRRQVMNQEDEPQNDPLYDLAGTAARSVRSSESERGGTASNFKRREAMARQQPSTEKDNENGYCDVSTDDETC